MDKIPQAPSRLGAPALGARIASGAIAGKTLAGGRGASTGAAAALVGAFAGHRARETLARTTGWPDYRGALIEDAAAATIAGIAAKQQLQP